MLNIYTFISICTSFEDCSVYLLIELFVTLLFKVFSSLYILDIYPLSDDYLAKFCPILYLSLHTDYCFLYETKAF
jgi:hypothetical protein